ncbi:MAG: Ycf66 family protein [Thainema sp.]
MAHLLAFALARGLAIAVGLGSFALYMAAFFFPEVHRKPDLVWSGVGLLYAVVLWFCAGQIEGALLLGQIAGVALLVWLGWQVLTLRRIKTPIQQQTLPGASSQDLTQVALGQAKAAADNFSIAETATAIAGITSSAIAAARGQSQPSQSTPQACPIDTSVTQARSQSSPRPASAQLAQPIKQPQPEPQSPIAPPSVSVQSKVRSQPSERQATPVETTGKSEQPEQVTSGQAAQTAQTAQTAATDVTGKDITNKDATDEEILQPIVSPPVESTTAATPAAASTTAAAAADEEWGNWMEDEDFGESTAETVTVASVQADTVTQSSPTVDRSAFDPAPASTPVNQPAAPSQNQSKSKLGLLTDWIGGLLPFGKKKKSQPMVTLPPRESSLPRSPNAAQPKSSQPMLTIPRRESSLRRPSPPTPDAATAAPSTAGETQESEIAPASSQTPPLSDDANGVTVNPEAVTDTSATQTPPQPSPEEILIPETLPSDEEAWGRLSAIANQEDDALAEAVLIEDATSTEAPVSEILEVAEDIAEEIKESAESSTDANLKTDIDEAIDAADTVDATDATDATDAIADSPPDSVSLADTSLTVTPESTDDEAPEALDADDSELTDSHAIDHLEVDQADESNDEQTAEVDLSEAAPDLQNEQPDQSLATDELQSSPAEPGASGATVDVEADAGDPENEAHSDELVTESVEVVAAADGDRGDETNDQPDNQSDDSADEDDAGDQAAAAETDATEAQSTEDHDSNTDHPALKRPNPPSQDLLDDLQRQHYTDYGRE